MTNQSTAEQYRKEWKKVLQYVQNLKEVEAVFIK